MGTSAALQDILGDDVILHRLSVEMESGIRRPLWAIQLPRPHYQALSSGQQGRQGRLSLLTGNDTEESCWSRSFSLLKRREEKKEVLGRLITDETSRCYFLPTAIQLSVGSISSRIDVHELIEVIALVDEAVKQLEFYLAVLES